MDYYYFAWLVFPILYLYYVLFGRKSVIFYLREKQKQKQKQERRRHSTNRGDGVENIVKVPSSTPPCVDLVFSDDVLVVILCRLPNKDIVRCKSVSKSWNKLVSEHCIPRINSKLSGLLLHTSFIYEKCPNGDWAFASFTEGKNAWIEAPLAGRDKSFPAYCFSLLPFKPRSQNLLDCSNGCLLFFDTSSSQFFVCNPTTKQYDAILHPNPIGKKVGKAGGLAFDTSNHGSYYYVVYLARVPLQVCVFSSLTQNWQIYKDLYLEPAIIKSFWTCRFVFLGGVFYRLSSSGHILKFGFKKKGAAAIKLPETVTIHKNSMGSCGVSQGLLHYAWGDGLYKLTVWMLDESGESRNWIVQHTLLYQDFMKHPRNGPRTSRLLSVYSFHPTSDAIFLGHRGAIYSYHLNDKKWDNVYVVGFGPSICCGQSFVFPFSHNLISLDAFGPSRKEERTRYQLATERQKSLSFQQWRKCRHKL